MDRQDAKPRRPSLLAGAPEHATATPSSARILADMSGHKPATRDAGKLPRRRWLWLATAAMVVIAAGWFWQTGFLRGNTGTSQRLTQEAAAQPSLHAATDAGTAGPDRELAATIIDDATPLSDDGSDATAGATSGVAEPSPFAAMVATSTKSKPHKAPVADNPFITPAPSRPAASRSRAPSASRTARSSGDQTNLISTLLSNIQTPAEPQPSGLDSLIQKMESAEKIDTPPSTVHAEAVPTPSKQIQANLRECPAANTAKGLKCRQEICAVYAGRDPACPAM